MALSSAALSSYWPIAKSTLQLTRQIAGGRVEIDHRMARVTPAKHFAKLHQVQPAGATNPSGCGVPGIVPDAAAQPGAGLGRSEQHINVAGFGAVHKGSGVSAHFLQQPARLG